MRRTQSSAGNLKALSTADLDPRSHDLHTETVDSFSIYCGDFCGDSHGKLMKNDGKGHEQRLLANH